MRRNVEPFEVPIGIGIDEVGERSRPVPIALRAVLRRFDFRDPVDELPPCGVDVVADRVDHHLAVGKPAGAHHAGARQERLPGRHAAPHVDARVARLAFMRMQLLADDRMQPVAADHHVGALRRTRIACPRIDEMDGDPAAALRETRALPAHVDAVGAQPTRARFEQHPLQVAAMQRELRRRVTGAPPERLAVDELSEAVVENRLPGLDGDAASARASSPSAHSSSLACGSTLIPAPSGRNSVVASNTRAGIPARCNVNASVSPPMPAPTMITSMAVQSRWLQSHSPSNPSESTVLPPVGIGEPGGKAAGISLGRAHVVPVDSCATLGYDAPTTRDNSFAALLSAACGMADAVGYAGTGGILLQRCDFLSSRPRAAAILTRSRCAVDAGAS